MQASPPKPPAPPLTPVIAAGATDAAVALQSKDLLGPHQTIDIEHNGQRYRLQNTRSGKLILTK